MEVDTRPDSGASGGITGATAHGGIASPGVAVWPNTLEETVRSPSPTPDNRLTICPQKGDNRPLSDAWRGGALFDGRLVGPTPVSAGAFLAPADRSDAGSIPAASTTPPSR